MKEIAVTSEPLESPLAGDLAAPHAATTPGSRLNDYIELTKPRITGMVLVTTFIGFLLAASPVKPMLLALTIFGTGLVTAGAQCLNQLWERRTDALMLRTRNRPIPASRIAPAEALLFGAALSVVGIATLAVVANPLTSALAALALGSYLFVYTPMKRVSPLCTLVGAIPGAIPPVIGWAAASGHLEAGALALFAILFVWQMPHFYAIAWMLRDDYSRGGFPMISAALYP